MNKFKCGWLGVEPMVAYCHMAQWLQQKLEPREWGGVLDTPGHDFTTPKNYIFLPSWSDESEKKREYGRQIAVHIAKTRPS